MYSAIKYSVFFAFFVFSMVSNVIGAITPLLIEKFSLSMSEGGLLTMAFMISYGIASIPAGIYSDKHGKKNTMLLGIAIMFIGLVSFLIGNQFIFLLLSMLVAGIGVTFIQVGANTLIEEISKAGEYVKNINVTHAIFGIGSGLVPLLIGYLLKSGYDWRISYMVLTALTIPLFFITFKSRAPKHIADEKFDLKLLSSKLTDTHLMSFAVGLFLYVGIEGGMATWLVLFLKNELGMGVQTGVIALSLFFGLLALGRYVGGHLTHKYSPRTMLSLFTVGAMISLALGLAVKSIAFYALPLTGFFLSIMFPTMYSVAIENTKSNKGTASGVLFSAVGGGAITPYLMGVVGDKYGLTASFSILFISLGYILLRALTIKRKHIEIEKDLLNKAVVETV